MKDLIIKTIERLKKWNWFYSVHREIKLLKSQRKTLWAYAINQFEEKPPEHGSLRDYRKALLQHRADFKEYNTYEFWRLNERERMSYLTEKEMKCIYRKVADVNENKWIDNKLMTHLKFAKYMHRDWICPHLVSYDTFRQFISSNDCIVKPWDGSLGRGVYLVKEGCEKDLLELYDNCRNNGLMVEERVQACKEISEFHSQSLNTIRVMTMLKGDRFKVVGCMFRMGVGNHVVDNGSAGGILAPIDSETGIVTGYGKDKNGNVFIHHPDSGKAIKGFAIPCWNKVLAACKEMATCIPKKVFAGWDVCVLDTGEIELIEVNSGPNIMGLQTAYGYGLRPRIQELGKELLGLDLMKLIPVWSRPLSNYEKYMQYKRNVRNPDFMLKEYVEYSLKRE